MKEPKDAADGADVTLARARDVVEAALEFPPCPDTVDERERFFMRLMAKGAYETGETDRMAAEAWGLALATIHRDTATASRRVRDLVDRDAVRLRVAEAFDEALDMAREQKDPRAVATVGDKFAGLVGANAPQRHELTGANGAPLNLPHAIALVWEQQATDPRAALLVQGYLATGEATLLGQLERARELVRELEAAAGLPLLVEAVDVTEDAATEEPSG